MQDLIDKKITLGICGGIAAYKSAYLVRELTRLGAEVRVVMTHSAQQFITPLTLQALSGQDVRSELFDKEAERAMGHIELARWGDLLVIAPASANCLAKLAHGLADDLLSTLYLASKAPVIVCPAMNQAMWHHQATQENIDRLKQRGVIVVGPGEGEQACGDIGLGRLCEIEDIIDALRLYKVHNALFGKEVIITAGPTHEAIDPVRYLSNHSSGKMGYALAKAAKMAGAKVTLISGPTYLAPIEGVRMVNITSAKSMLDRVMSHLTRGAVFIGCAAVADYTPETVSPQKIKKQENDVLTLRLSKNPDILKAVSERSLASFVVGFAAETDNLLNHAQEKLSNKKADMIIANQVGAGLVFGQDENEVIIITKEEQIYLEPCNKVALAGQIIEIIAKKSASS